MFILSCHTLLSIRQIEALVLNQVSLTLILFSPRLQFRFIHRQAALIVALRHALDYLLVRAATTPAIIAEPNDMDEKILHVIKALSRANAGSFGLRGGSFNSVDTPLRKYRWVLANSCWFLLTLSVIIHRQAKYTHEWENVYNKTCVVCTFLTCSFLPLREVSVEVLCLLSSSFIVCFM